jgi:hypothetical protein
MNITNQYKRILGQKIIEKHNCKRVDADPLQMNLNIKIIPTTSPRVNYN